MKHSTGKQHYNYYITKQIPRDINQLYMMLICTIISVFFNIPFPHQQIISNKITKMFSQEGIKYPCRHCGKEFSKKVSRAKHQRRVHEGVNFPCGQCGKQFSQKENLARHQRGVHEGFKYSCRQCDYQATTKGSLGEHKRAVHEGVK